ncbi:hypothetical protein LTR78_001044 [Recurvomyces mirabilis]|uniref:L-ornithine N(5)-monooxygenase [NAD(P)H] n=1 Tax=Recurvomyces mirabilis TaxID=574656 RepID=A0AAE0WX34_9PEZI|nr:hypothetical protein LTR78_001044 [Recurvomyces mirabilis]KAK5159016.1 hypothetical protein LTS14_003124 [Recurvomyces mirabilis]
MSPHALSEHEECETSCTEHRTEAPTLTANPVTNASHSLWKTASDEEIQDLICVGFGPASLAIAIALNDALEVVRPHLCTSSPKVRFLERQARFAWHAGMLLPGAKMQITFVKDLATLRNPRSEFTFLNYLHKKNRLVQFTNLGTFLPQRIEYENYMRWCANHFGDVVDYNRDVQSIEAGSTCPRTGAIEHFRVTSTDSTTGHSTTLKARHVVIAAGGKPNIPAALPSNHPRIIHSSQYATTVSQMFCNGQQPRSVAVIGAGQSAAEVFNNIPSRFPDAKSYLLIRGSALRPSDDSPFVNEVFDPDRVDDIYSQDPAVRAQEIARDKATNYSVVRLELLEHIYSMLYSYRIQYDSEEEWPQQILNHRTVTGVEDCEVDGRAALTLHIQNDSNTFKQRKNASIDELVVDFIVVASGYRRDAHEDMLRGLQQLKPDGHNRWNVRRDYGVQFVDGSVKSNAGVWLQGCNEQTHGLSDSLLSILAIRGGEMVESIFGGAATSK